MKRLALLTVFPVFAAAAFAQQAPLPVITVKNINNKIIVSWVNEYAKPVSTLNIQRSYDSLKNFSTIGTVLSPQSRENGFVDANPPYNRMYYRVFVAFEGGSYIITPSARPVKDISENEPVNEKYPWMANPLSVKDSAELSPVKPGITYPSMRVFTAKDNNVIIHLPEAPLKKYSVKFFDESDKLIFELNKLQEEYLIVEKVNFVHTGWFHFEVYENGELVESNKFQILKDSKKL